MNRKVLLASMAATIVIPALVVYPVQYEAGYEKPFSDVSSNNAYYDIIHTMRDKGIIYGYEDGTFKPNETLSRRHAAALINRAVVLPKTNPFIKPNDLSEKNANYDDLKALIEAGLLKSDSKGNINIDTPLTRGEMAEILTVAFNLEVKADYIFTDVIGTKYEKYVKALYSNGITTGFEDNTFKVDESLTRAHYAVFMYRAMNLDVNFESKPIKPAEKDNPNVGTDKESDKNPTKPPVVKPPTKPNTDKEPSQNVEDYPKDKVTNDNSNRLDDLEVPGNGNKFDLLKKQQEEAVKLQRKNVIRREAGTTIIAVGSEYSKVVQHISSKTEVSNADMIQIINYAEATGNVYDGGTFYLYLDFTKGVLVYGY